MKLLTTLTLLLASTVLAATAEAGGNRRISDVRIVHPPGSPPGTWRVDADMELLDDGTLPSPTDYSFELTLSLNGTPISTVLEPVVYAAAASCNFATCNGGGCGTWLGPHNWSAGFCRLVTLGSGLQLCGCLGVRTIGSGNNGTSLLRTDQLTVTITPVPGTLQDIDVSDDTFTLVVSDNEIGTPFCAGDATSPVPCPCANTGADGNGCANSANPGGAHLGATGWSQADPNTGTDSVVLHGTGMPATATAIYLKGDAAVPSATFGDGLLCTGGALIRLRTKINVGGASSFPEPGDPSLSVRGATPPGSGLTGHYQVYYRNAAAAFCPPATFNVSSGTMITW